MNDRVVVAELLVIGVSSVWLLLLLRQALREAREQASSGAGNRPQVVPSPSHDDKSNSVRVCGIWISEESVRLLISNLIANGRPEALHLAQDLALIVLMAREQDFTFSAGQRETLLEHIPEPVPIGLRSLRRKLFNDPEIAKHRQQKAAGEVTADNDHGRQDEQR